jgi:hypothetical protein
VIPDTTHRITAMHPTAVVEQLNAHIESFVQRPHPGLLNQPVCPFARRARSDGRVVLTVVPYSVADDSAISWAFDQFEPQGKDVLLVIHPDPTGLDYPELSELRDRFARLLEGRYEVFTGHPDDPYTRNGVRTRCEPFPVLHFVRFERLRQAERMLSPRRRAL